MNPASRKELLLAASEKQRARLVEDYIYLKSSTAALKQRARNISIATMIGGALFVGLVLRAAFVMERRSKK